MPAVWSSILTALVVGVAAQVDPSSVVGNTAGTGYQANQLQNGIAAATQAIAGAAGVTPAPLPAGSFDPMAPPVTTSAGPAVANALVDALTGNQAGLKAESAAAIAEAPMAAADYVEGFIQGYFAKVTLAPDEKSCMQQNIHVMVKDVVSIISELGQVIAALIGAHAQQQNPDGNVAPPAGGLNVLTLMSGAGQVVQIVTTTQALLKGCVRADAVAVMNQTLAHLKDPLYVKGRLLANGIDIAKVIADSIPAWQSNNFKKVGQDFGTLVRKVLLSRNSGPVRMVLPEGMMRGEVGPAIVDGIIKGLFVEGTSVTISNTKDPTIHIFIDLHRCIAKEAKYFSTAMNAIYLSIAQITTNIEQFQLNQKGIQAEPANPLGAPISGVGQTNAGLDEAGNWMSTLSGLMTNLPVLMDRCGMGADQRLMMSRAIKSMQDISMAFSVPGPKDRMQAGNMAAVKFEEATKAWKVGNYALFGEELGGLMRDLLLVIWPQQYHVDNGQLRAFVDSKVQTIESGKGSLALAVGGFSAVALVGLSVVRISRPSTRPAEVDMDMEALREQDCIAVE